MARKKSERVGGWIVKIRCVVDKQVICDDCTEAEAHNDPWEHASEETEIGQDDWDVISVEPNE